MSDCAPAPSQKPSRFISASDPVLEWFAGGRPRLIQCILCRAANSPNWIKVASLSTEREPELVTHLRLVDTEQQGFGTLHLLHTALDGLCLPAV